MGTSRLWKVLGAVFVLSSAALGWLGREIFAAGGLCLAVYALKLLRKPPAVILQPNLALSQRPGG